VNVCGKQNITYFMSYWKIITSLKKRCSVSAGRLSKAVFLEVISLKHKNTKLKMNTQTLFGTLTAKIRLFFLSSHILYLKFI
jgi:hypothetical protein